MAEAFNNPVIIAFAVGGIITVLAFVAFNVFGRKGAKQEEDSSKKIQVEKLREIVKVHEERKAAVAQSTGLEVNTNSSAFAAAGEGEETQPTLSGDAGKTAKKRNRAKKSSSTSASNTPAKAVDPDTALIAMFGGSNGKKANKNNKTSEKGRGRKKHPKHVRSATDYGYNTDDSDDSGASDADQVITGQFKSVSTTTTPGLPTPHHHAGTEVTASMLAAAADTQFFTTSEQAQQDNTSVSHSSTTEMEIANLKQLELSAELEASLIAGLSRPTSVDNFFVSSTTTDGWAVVEDKRKVRLTKKQEAGIAAIEHQAAESTATPPPASASTAPTAAAAPPAPLVIDITKAQVGVESNKVGLIVGPRGATLKLMQEATGVEIIVPRVKDLTGSNNNNNNNASVGDNIVIIHLVGPSEGVASATKAIEDLCMKGYSSVLEGPDFGETTINVHSSHVADIIGKSGSTRRVLQEVLGVRVVVPPNSNASNPSNNNSGNNSSNNNSSSTTNASSDGSVKVTIAGPRMKVSECKKLLKDLVKYHHSSVTHPDLTHIEIEPSHAFFSYLSTCRNADIRSLHTNHKVTVFLPGDHTVCKNILLVGDSDGLAAAEAQLFKNIESRNVDKSTAALLSESWAASPVVPTAVASPPLAPAAVPLAASSAAVSISSIVASELGSSIANPWLGGLVSSPPATSSTPGSAGVPSTGSGAAVTSPPAISRAVGNNNTSSTANTNNSANNSWDHPSAEGW